MQRETMPAAPETNRLVTKPATGGRGNAAVYGRRSASSPR
jgi:hypothetical protein